MTVGKNCQPPGGKAMPRLFALVQATDDDGDDISSVAYGIAFPDGSAATVSPEGRSFGSWTSPTQAACCFGADIVWLSATAESVD